MRATLFGVFLLVVGCSSTPAPTDASTDAIEELDAGASVPESGATITGSQAFPVAFAWMNPAQPASECGPNQVGNAYAATAIDLFESDESQAACANSFGSATGRYVAIEIATTAYAGQHAITQPLAAGTYVIGNEHVPDEDLCMLPANTNAILQVLAFGDAGYGNAAWNAVSGQVIVTTVSGTHIEGNFSVQLGDVNGGPADGGALSGNFIASTCP